MNIEVVIPAYNEAQNLPLTIKGIRDSLGKDCRIIVVDDASVDNTAKEAGDLGAKVIRHPYRMGNGASIKTGIRNSSADILILMDADGQHNPKDIGSLLKYISEYDMVIGARDFSRITPRNFANIIYNIFATYITHFKILDLTSGFRVVKRNIAVKFLYLLPNGFSYPTTITLSFLKTGRAIKYVSIESGPRLKGKSSINILADGTKFFIIIARIATFFSPLRVFLPVSLVFFVSGLAYYLHTYFTQHRFTNMAVFLLSNSVLIFMLGLVSEQISQLRMDQTENTPVDKR